MVKDIKMLRHKHKSKSEAKYVSTPTAILDVWVHFGYPVRIHASNCGFTRRRIAHRQWQVMPLSVADTIKHELCLRCKKEVERLLTIEEIRKLALKRAKEIRYEHEHEQENNFHYTNTFV